MSTAIVAIVGLGAVAWYLLKMSGPDQSGWPTGDRIWDICRAIATAEGFGTSGAVPTTQHNPGDITDGASTYGAGVNGITTFPDDLTGWNALYSKVQNIVNGGSSVYPQNASISAIAATWTATAPADWASNVSNALGVDPSTGFSDYVNGAAASANSDQVASLGSSAIPDQSDDSGLDDSSYDDGVPA